MQERLLAIVLALAINCKFDGDLAARAFSARSVDLRTHKWIYNLDMMLALQELIRQRKYLILLLANLFLRG